MTNCATSISRSPRRGWARCCCGAPRCTGSGANGTRRSPTALGAERAGAARRRGRRAARPGAARCRPPGAARAVARPRCSRARRRRPRRVCCAPVPALRLGDAVGRRGRLRGRGRRGCLRRCPTTISPGPARSAPPDATARPSAASIRAWRGSVRCRCCNWRRSTPRRGRATLRRRAAPPRRGHRPQPRPAAPARPPRRAAGAARAARRMPGLPIEHALTALESRRPRAAEHRRRGARAPHRAALAAPPPTRGDADETRAVRRTRDLGGRASRADEAPISGSQASPSHVYRGPSEGGLLGSGALHVVLLRSGRARVCSRRFAQTVTRGPYLQLGSDTRITVRWRTDVATDSGVRYGADAGDADQRRQRSRRSTTEHVVALTGLARRHRATTTRSAPPAARSPAATSTTPSCTAPRAGHGQADAHLGDRRLGHRQRQRQRRARRLRRLHRRRRAPTSG